MITQRDLAKYDGMKEAFLEQKQRAEAAEERCKRLNDAIIWALGYTDFAERKDGQGKYWWRSGLRERCGDALLVERAEQAEAQVAAYEWIPVSERLPDTRGELGHSTSVLIWNPDCECVFMAVRREDEGWEDWTNGQHKHSESEITHWMPSPEPPSIPPPMPTEGGKEHP